MRTCSEHSSASDEQESYNDNKLRSFLSELEYSISSFTADLLETELSLFSLSFALFMAVLSQSQLLFLLPCLFILAPIFIVVTAIVAMWIFLWNAIKCVFTIDNYKSEANWLKNARHNPPFPNKQFNMDKFYLPKL